MVKKKQLVFAVSPSTKASLSSLPVSITSTLTTALRQAHADPSKLARALDKRMTEPPEENTARISALLDETLTELHNFLSTRSRLSAEEVARLAVEAFIHKL